MARRIPKNYAAARRLSDEARARAFARVDAISEREIARQEMLLSRPVRQRPDTPPPIDVLIDRRVADDPFFKVAVADNRWWIDTATMYAQGEIIERLDLIVGLLARLCEQLEKNA